MTKDELRAYIPIKRELEQLDRERERLYALMERSVKAPGVFPVRGNACDPYPGLVDRLAEVREKTEQTALELMGKRIRIEEAIDGLPPRERFIMRARYIEGRKWEDIALALHYSAQHLWRVHGAVLQKMRVNESS